MVKLVKIRNCWYIINKGVNICIIWNVRINVCKNFGFFYLFYFRLDNDNIGICWEYDFFVIKLYINIFYF